MSAMEPHPRGRFHTSSTQHIAAVLFFLLTPVFGLSLQHGRVSAHTEAATSEGSVAYNELAGVNYQSGHVASYNLKSKRDCEAKCSRRSECTAYTFFAKKYGNWRKTCFLRRSVGKKVSCTDCVSAIKAVAQDDDERPEPLIDSQPDLDASAIEVDETSPSQEETITPLDEGDAAPRAEEESLSEAEAASMSGEEASVATGEEAGSTMEDGDVAAQDTVEVDEGPAALPSIFVAVFSSLKNIDRRNFFRKGLRQSGLADGGPVLARFAVCHHKDGTVPDFVFNESDENNDMMMLDCDEEWSSGATTKKLHAAMRVYRGLYRETAAFFMRVDDDNFIAWHRLLRFLAEQEEGGSNAYIGVPVRDRPVNRQPSSPWYQPKEIFAGNTFPVYMQRTSGIIMGRQLVDEILARKIADRNRLTNEDQAAGVWVAKVREEGVKVNMVAMASGDGHLSQMRNTQWGEYEFLTHRNIAGNAIECLSRLDAIDDPSHKVGSCFGETMFISVFSARPNKALRASFRENMANADADVGGIDYKFILCTAEDSYTEELREEQDQYGDIAVLGCEEGYARKLLTKKLLAAMNLYKDSYSGRRMFMKTDDDTFVFWRRLRGMINGLKDPQRSYVGLPAKDDVKVNRDPQSRWYQPPDVYPNSTYPDTMEGGPGYIIGGDMVRRILSEGIGTKLLLSNEDQAVGVWMDQLKQRGVDVVYAPVPGTDGYRPEFDTCYGTLKDYPYFLHHKLKESSVSCMAKLTSIGDNSQPIDDCFPDCVKLATVALKGRMDTISNSVRGAMHKLTILQAELQDAFRSMQWLSRKASSSIADDSV